MSFAFSTNYFSQEQFDGMIDTYSNIDHPDDEIWNNIKNNVLVPELGTLSRIKESLNNIEEHLTVYKVASIYKTLLTSICARYTASCAVLDKRLNATNLSSCVKIEAAPGTKYLIQAKVLYERLSSAEETDILMKFVREIPILRTDSESDTDFNKLVRTIDEIRAFDVSDKTLEVCDKFQTLCECFRNQRETNFAINKEEDQISDRVYHPLIFEDNLVDNFFKNQPLASVLNDHVKLMQYYRKYCMRIEMAPITEEMDRKYLSHESDDCLSLRIQAFFNETEGFREEDIKNLKGKVCALREVMKNRELKKQLLKINGLLANLLETYSRSEEGSSSQVSEPASSESQEDWLPVVIKPVKASQSKKGKGKKRSRGNRKRKCVNPEGGSSSASEVGEVKNRTKRSIWNANVPATHFPHELTWAEHVTRWYEENPSCLQEGAYASLSESDKVLEHYCHRLPPTIDRFVDSDYTIKNEWVNLSGAEEVDEMYSIPSALEYKDPISQERNLLLGHICIVVNPRDKVIYHRYFHRSDRQLFGRTGLRKDALAEQWLSQAEELPNLAEVSGSSGSGGFTRPKENIHMLVNRVTESVAIIDNTLGTKIMLFKPNRGQQS